MIIRSGLVPGLASVRARSMAAAGELACNATRLSKRTEHKQPSQKNATAGPRPAARSPCTFGGMHPFGKSATELCLCNHVCFCLSKVIVVCPLAPPSRLFFFSFRLRDRFGRCFVRHAENRSEQPQKQQQQTTAVQRSSRAHNNSALTPVHTPLAAPRLGHCHRSPPQQPPAAFPSLLPIVPLFLLFPFFIRTRRTPASAHPPPLVPSRLVHPFSVLSPQSSSWAPVAAR